MNGVSIILKKELKRVFGDKKLVFSLFILPAIIMIALYGIMGFMMGAMSDDIEGHKNIVYFVNASDKLKDTIKSTGFDQGNEIHYLTDSEFKEEESVIRDEVLNNTSQLIVYSEPDFDKKFKNYSKAGDEIPVIKLYFNSTENYSSNTYSVFVATVLDEYKTKLISERIDNLEILNVFETQDEVIEKEAKAKSK